MNRLRCLACLAAILLAHGCSMQRIGPEARDLGEGARSDLQRDTDETGETGDRDLGEGAEGEPLGEKDRPGGE